MKKEYDFSKGNRGAMLPVPAGKTQVIIVWMTTFWIGSATKCGAPDRYLPG